MSNTKPKATQRLSFFMCASCLFVNHFLFLLFFFLLAVCSAKPHFADPLKLPAHGAEPESPSCCCASERAVFGKMFL